MIKNRQEKGITLIALVITIIVMLILVAVTITMAVDGGLFGRAADAGRQTNEAVLAEQELGSGVIKIKKGSTIYEYDNINAYFTNTPSKVYEDGKIEEETPDNPGGDDPIDQRIIVDETLTDKKFTLEIEDGYNATETPITKKLNPTLIGIEGTPIWTSKNKAVADVSQTGLVTAIGTGTAEITVSVTYRDVTYTDTCTVTVEGPKQYLGMTNEKIDSGIGCYVYVDGQYGVIYADLAFGVENGQWGDSYGAYTYGCNDEEKATLKKYYLNGTYDPGDEFGTAWGEKPLLVVDNEQGGTIDRFYVMALTDFTSGWRNELYWNWSLDYPHPYGDPYFETQNAFGSGVSNTDLLVNCDEVTWYSGDIWYYLGSGSSWFVPSSGEWSAFAQKLGVTSTNFPNYGLGEKYWSSTEGIWNLYDVQCASFKSGKIVDYNIYYNSESLDVVYPTLPVRLSSRY